MSKTLTQIAQELIDANKKVQLIYAFNGTGKTRLSREFKNLISPKNIDDSSNAVAEPSRNKILYYNAFTEDLFYWDNDLDADADPKLKIQPNTFTGWLITLLQDLGEDGNITTNFQRYTSSKATPTFNQEYERKTRDQNNNEIDVTIPAFSEVTFHVAKNDPSVPETPDEITEDNIAVVQGQYEKIKVSKGEESNFIWSVIYSLLEQVISTLNESDVTNRITDEFDNLEYIFIDDPVSSLDDTHLIELAVDLAQLIKMSTYTEGNGLKFIITTHSPLFYNVLHNELNNDFKKSNPDGTSSWIYKRGQSEKYRLYKQGDGTYELNKSNDHPFSYHLFLLSEVCRAINTDQIKKYHFSFLRNILEKSATFLGHPRWEDLLDKTAEGNPNPFASRIMNLSSHSAHAGEETADIEESDKERMKELVIYLINTYRFKTQEALNV
ncbi:TPA: AAA family ATPase [Klebsiella pneumoniae]|uniref:AAA family ATPase n=1 Tax=Klebsiella pneumoniae complex TaxID=3390273 RepID=UPI0020CE2BB6|nr:MULTISPECIES: AAA family ATPase [Klebsiella]MCQ0645749.1 AAA family ATPase [Klebsiella pneumoniae]MDV0461322.1 AAA family ATPase [Klebsiella quasipneumoniae subsp. similipneumoniae]MDV0823373.1 AAA family ATPase [Klebsiella quasipneumoniae subsp. similipneumoniae]MDV0864616.1 AAA family ATPase [Klebsiella quasipneumoniae subsp. similipneumoniae]HCA9724100.1 AAA family ATPase [Klebsiella pneumoniae]